MKHLLWIAVAVLMVCHRAAGQSCSLTVIGRADVCPPSQTPIVVAVDEGIAVVATATTLRAVDVRVAASPIPLGTTSVVGGAVYGMDYENGWVGVVDGSGTFRLYDFRTPTSPRSAGQYDIGPFIGFYGIDIVGNIAYIVDNGGGFTYIHAFDISSGTPALLSSAGGWNYSNVIAVGSDKSFVGMNFPFSSGVARPQVSVFQTSNPTSLSFCFRFDASTFWPSGNTTGLPWRDACAMGDTAYLVHPYAIAGRRAGTDACGNPASREYLWNLSHFTSDQFLAVDMNETKIFASRSSSGIRIFNRSNHQECGSLSTRRPVSMARQQRLLFGVESGVDDFWVMQIGADPEFVDPNPQPPVPSMVLGVTFDQTFPSRQNVDQRIDWSDAKMAAATKVVGGAACDGVTRLLHRVPVPGPGTVDFSLADENGATANVGYFGIPGATPNTTSLTGVPTRQVNGQHYGFASYVVPLNFWRTSADSNLTSRPARVTARFTPSGGGSSTTWTTTINLVRPPVLLLHGLTDPNDPNAEGSGMWKWALRKDPRFHVVYAHPYETTGNHSFAENIKQARIGAAHAAEAMRAKGYACTQVSVVGYSLGGILARLHAGNREGTYFRARNLGQGDFYKVITLYTPHYGSGWACLVERLYQAGSTVWREVLRRFGHDWQPPSLAPAMSDLRPDSNEIRQLPAIDVPTHVIAGVGGETALQLINSAAAGAATIPSPLRVVAVLVFTARTYWPELVGSSEHDMIVGKPSALGGLGGSASSTIGWLLKGSQIQSRGIHIGVGNEQFVGDQIIRPLLDEPIGSPKFAPGMPANSISNVPVPPVCSSRDIPNLQPANNGSLVIASPAPNTVVPAGGTLQLSLIPTGTFIPTSVFITSPIGTALGNAAPFTTTITVPANAVGQYVVQAFGIDDQFRVAFAADVTVQVSSTAVLQSLEMLNPYLPLTLPNEQSQVRVIGHYDTGITRDLTAAGTGTTYTSTDPLVVTVTTSGVVKPVTVGSARVYCGNAGLETFVEVAVAPSLCPADFNADNAVNTPDLVFFLGRFGQPVTPGSPAERADFNADGQVNTADLVFFLGRFGQPCP